MKTSTQLQPLAAFLARPTFGWLWLQNCLMGGHVLWKTCHSYGRTCLTEEPGTFLVGEHALWEDMS